MNEEIKRAMKRAEAVSTRSTSGRFGYSSPLGKGFTIDNKRPMKEQMNPYSRKGDRQHDDVDTGGFKVVYEEVYVNMNGGFDLNGAAKRSTIRSGKEYFVKRMNDQRKTRMRERGEPLPSDQRRHTSSSIRGGETLTNSGDAQSTLGCVIM